MVSWKKMNEPRVDERDKVSLTAKIRFDLVLTISDQKLKILEPAMSDFCVAEDDSISKMR